MNHDAACGFSSFDLLLSLTGEFQFCLWSLLRLFDKRMEQDHMSLISAKENACNSAATKIAPDFPEAAAERAAKRHAQWPPEFRRGDVKANNSAIIRWQC